MKVVDMHCDTLYELEKNHLSLSENNLNIDIKKDGRRRLSSTELCHLY